MLQTFKITLAIVATFAINTVWGQDSLDSLIAEKNYKEVILSMPDGFSLIERYAMYPEGREGILAHLVKHTKYPEEAMKKKIQGKVILSFLVETDGSVNDIKVVQSVHPLLDEEAIRVFKLMDKWIPAMQGGKAVKVLYNMPINFKL